MIIPVVFGLFFLLILLVPNQAFAGTAFLFGENFVHAEWPGPFVPTTDPVPAPITDFDEESPFDLFDNNFFMECGDVAEPAIQNDVLTECVFRLPNFVDELDTKFIFIDITFDPAGPPPSTPSVRCIDSTGPSDVMLLSSGIINENILLLLFKCMPNPDWETITVELPPNVQKVEISTRSFGDTPVGGEFIGIDSTMVLVAGAQYTAAWMIPVIVSGIGIAIVIARKF